MSRFVEHPEVSDVALCRAARDRNVQANIVRNMFEEFGGWTLEKSRSIAC